MVRIVLRAIWIGCLGMLLAMLAAFAVVVAALLFDPKCGPGDSGGCAMGLVTVTLGAALPGFIIGSVFRPGLLAQAPDAADDPPAAQLGARRLKTASLLAAGAAEPYLGWRVDAPGARKRQCRPKGIGS
jgi:Na+/H+-dicarboxylate symporter